VNAESAVRLLIIPGRVLCTCHIVHAQELNPRAYVITPASSMTGVPAHQLDILEQMGVTIVQTRSVAGLAPADVVLDGLIPAVGAAWSRTRAATRS
jgi:hypothetical protein